MENYLFYSILATGSLCMVFLLTMLVQSMSFRKEEKRLNYEEGIQRVLRARAKSKDVFEYLEKNIRSCSKFSELANCHGWVLKHEYNLSPTQLDYLLSLIRKKQREVEEHYADMVGHSVGKMQ